MASGLCDAAKPRRFDLTMSRRTRRPASLIADGHQGQGIEGPQMMLQPHDQVQDADAELKTAPAQCPYTSDHLRSQHSEDTEAHKTSEESGHTQEQTPPQKCVEGTEKTQQQQCQGNSPRRLSLQELIEDESLDGEKGVATGNQEEKAAAVHEVAEPAGAKKEPEHVAGRRVIGMMRRYVRVRPIKPKHAPEKNVGPIC
ncbi:uncharacterized protein LOC133905181 [Phragmites australis]|uniref:uncharacterized protein LOC133905181 n=1 Tax=Phragmites australis TaxID=29695 RepID=UPI002D78367C|nr:uncharacterized protein LOC133905181 [Phragmites australis]